jgi:hypothetical protein
VAARTFAPASDRPAPDLRRPINVQIGLLTADYARVSDQLLDLLNTWGHAAVCDKVQPPKKKEKWVADLLSNGLHPTVVVLEGDIRPSYQRTRFDCAFELATPQSPDCAIIR